mmetsp:Transcript_2336/g.6140  ORF Transcript_2336/g.6140 Transcript_2336/m.6140 type:complete len:266 (-) Transcript_2336:890-1687(-)
MGLRVFSGAVSLEQGLLTGQVLQVGGESRGRVYPPADVLVRRVQDVVDLPPLGVERPRRVGARQHGGRLVGEDDVAAAHLLQVLIVGHHRVAPAVVVVVGEAEVLTSLHDDLGDLGEVGDGDGGEEVVLDLEAEPAAVQQLPEGRVEVARRLHLQLAEVGGRLAVHTSRLERFLLLEALAVLVAHGEGEYHDEGADAKHEEHLPECDAPAAAGEERAAHGEDEADLAEDEAGQLDGSRVVDRHRVVVVAPAAGDDRLAVDERGDG